MVMCQFIGLIPQTVTTCSVAFDWLASEAPFIIPKIGISPYEAEMIFRKVMRFNPINNGVLRIAEHDVILSTVLAVRHITKGTIVLAATMSAMLAPKFAPKPNEVQLDRPSSVYLYDGYGLHARLGRYANVTNVRLLLTSPLNAGYMPVPEKRNIDFQLRFST